MVHLARSGCEETTFQVLKLFGVGVTVEVRSTASIIFSTTA
jgi:hypothetical protein